MLELNFLFDKRKIYFAVVFRLMVMMVVVVMVVAMSI